MGDRLYSALAARAYFLLLRQKKVAKEKATPGCAVGCARSLALLGTPHGDPKDVAALPVSRNTGCCGRPSKKAKNAERRLSPDGFPGPLRGAEQRRNAGGSRRALFEGRSPELRSRPAFRVAQGTRQSRAPTQGWLFLWLLSFGHTKESTPAAKAETGASTSAKA